MYCHATEQVLAYANNISLTMHDARKEALLSEISSVKHTSSMKDTRQGGMLAVYLRLGVSAKVQRAPFQQRPQIAGRELQDLVELPVQELLHQIVYLPLVALPVPRHPVLTELAHQVIGLAVLAPWGFPTIEVWQAPLADLLHDQNTEIGFGKRRAAQMLCTAAL